jgi:hypothetical protein
MSGFTRGSKILALLIRSNSLPRVPLCVTASRVIRSNFLSMSRLARFKTSSLPRNSITSLSGFRSCRPSFSFTRPGNRNIYLFSLLRLLRCRSASGYIPALKHAFIERIEIPLCEIDRLTAACCEGTRPQGTSAVLLWALAKGNSRTPSQAPLSFSGDNPEVLRVIPSEHHASVVGQIVSSLALEQATWFPNQGPVHLMVASLPLMYSTRVT